MICNRCKVDKDPEKDFIHGKLKCRECYKKCREYYQAHRAECIKRATDAQNKDRVSTNSKKRSRCRKNPASYMLWNIKSRAKKRGIPFDLTIDDIQIPERCPILGIKLEMGTGSPSPNSPSLDRINPEYGYVRGNVQVISHRANTIKSDATLTELRLIVEYMEKQSPSVLENATCDFTTISRHAEKNNSKFMDSEKYAAWCASHCRD